MNEAELKLWETYWETYFAIRGPIDKPWHPVANETYCTAPTGLASPAERDDNLSDTQAFPEDFDFSTMLEIHYRLQELDNSRRGIGQQQAPSEHPGEAPRTSSKNDKLVTVTELIGETANGIGGSSRFDQSANTSPFPKSDDQRENTRSDQMSDSSSQNWLPGKDPTVAEDAQLGSCSPTPPTAMGKPRLQQPTKSRQEHGSSWVSPSLYGPPSPFLSAVQYPSVLMQPYYEDLTHGPVNHNGSSPILQPTKAELSFFQGAVAPTLEHLPPPRYTIGEHPKLFRTESTQGVDPEQLDTPGTMTQDVPDDNLQLPAHKHVRKPKKRPRSEFAEKYGYHPALRHFWEPELEKSRAELAMAENSSESSESSDQEYYEGDWGPPTPIGPTTTYEDISAGGETPTTYVEDLPFHACYDDTLVPRKYPKIPGPVLYNEPTASPEDPYENIDRQYREDQQLPGRDLDPAESPIGFPVPKELKGFLPPSTLVDVDVYMGAGDVQAPYIPWSSTNQPSQLTGYIEQENMEQVLRDYPFGDSPKSGTQANHALSKKRKLDEDEISQRKKQRFSVDRFDDYDFPQTLPHEQDENLEYIQAVTESYSEQTGDLVAIATGWELRRRTNASWRNQRRGKVFSRSQSPSPPSVVGDGSGVLIEGETLVDALSEASSGDPTMVDKEQTWQLPEMGTPHLSNKETPQQLVQPAETRHEEAHHLNSATEASTSLDHSGQPTQKPLAMSYQKPEVVVPPLSPKLRDQYIEHVYPSKKNKGTPAKGGSRRLRGSSASGQKKETRKRIVLKCDRVTRSTPVKEKTLMKLDM